LYSGRAREITCENSLAYTSHKDGSNKSPSRSITTPNRARVADLARNSSSSSSARSINASSVRAGQVPSCKQESSTSCASSLAGILGNQKPQSLLDRFRDSAAVRNHRVLERRAALARSRFRHCCHYMPDQL